MATDQAVRSELRMHGLLPHRHVSLQLEIDRASGALQACSTPLEQYKVALHVHRLKLKVMSLLGTPQQPEHSCRSSFAGLGCSAGAQPRCFFWAACTKYQQAPTYHIYTHSWRRLQELVCTPAEAPRALCQHQRQGNSYKQCGSKCNQHLAAAQP